MSHVLEHLNPKHMVDIFNEAWRVLDTARRGQWLLAVPYAGSPGFWQDPTHTKGITEATLAYFTKNYPNDPTGVLYSIYKPRPWNIVKLVYSPLHNLEAVLEPQPVTAVEERQWQERATLARRSQTIIDRYKRQRRTR